MDPSKKTYALMLSIEPNNQEEEENLGIHLTLLIKFVSTQEQEDDLVRRFKRICKKNYLTRGNAKAVVSDENLMMGPSKNVPAMGLQFVEKATNEKVDILWEALNDPQEHTKHLESCNFHLTKKGNFSRKLGEVVSFKELVLKCVETKEKFVHDLEDC